MSTINNSSTYGNLLHQAPADLRKLFRKLESLERKLIILNWSTTFNGICIKENLLPTYVKLRHHDPALNNDVCTRKYQISLIEREIKQNDAKISKVKNEIDNVKHCIS